VESFPATFGKTYVQPFTDSVRLPSFYDGSFSQLIWPLLTSWFIEIPNLVQDLPR